MKNKNELILTVDVGTQSIRAVLFDLKGEIVDIVKTNITPYFSVKPGYAEQHPEYFWEKFCETTKSLFLKNSEIKDNIKALAITTQRGTIINLDKNHNVLRPAIVWLDQRMANVGDFPKTFTQMIYSFVNIREAVKHAVRNGECNWLIQNQKEIWDKTDKYLYLSGYLYYKLTGEFVESTGNTVGYMPFDYKKHEWVSDTHRNFKMFPVEKEKLPKLFKPSEQIGFVSKTASKETGIAKGLPIIASASDKACEVLGSGVISPKSACLSYGTTATVQTSIKKYVEVINFFPPYPGAIPNYYNTEIMIYRGFWMVNWFKQQFGQYEINLAKEKGVNPEEIFGEMIENIPPGSMGLTLQPYWSPGVKIPGTEAKGAIIGFGDIHTRAHVYKAILEGIAYALKEGLIRIQKKTKINIERLIVSGGGSQSKQAMQMTADIFNMPAEKPHTYETSSLGAAINAAVGMNFYDSFEDAVKNMCRTKEIYTPKVENADIYKQLFKKVYRRMYGKLKPLYRKIRKITDYPEKI